MADVPKFSLVTVAKVYEKREHEDVPLEEALDRTGYGWYNVKLCAVSMFILMAMALEIFGLSFILTGSSCDLGLDDGKRGLLGTMPMLGVIVSAYGWGVAADRGGRRRALLVSLGGAFLVSVVGTFSPHWIVLAVAKFFSAAFASATNAVAYTLFGESTPRRHRDKMVLFITSGFMLSQGVMALLAWPVLQTKVDFPIPFLGIRFLPWRLLALVGATPCGLGAFALLFCEESPKFLLTSGRPDEALKVLRRMYAVNSGRKAEEYPVKSLLLETPDKSRQISATRALWEQAAPLFRPPLLRHSIIITYVVIVVYMVPPSFMMWLPTIANRFFTALESGHLSPADNFCSVINMHVDYNTTQGPPPCDDSLNFLSAISVVTFAGASCLVATVLTWCVARGVRKRHLVFAMHAAAGAAGLLLNAVPGPAAGAVLFPVFLMTVTCMGLMTAFTVQVFPTSLRAMSVCLTMMIGRGFSVIGMNLIGRLMESQCETTYYIFGAIILSGAMVSLLLPGDEQDADVKKTAEV